MDFELSEEQKQIKALIIEFCKREIDVNEMWELSQKAATVKNIQELRAIQPLHLIKKLHEIGLRQLAVPTKYGGGGVGRGGWLTRTIAAEAAGYAGGPVARLLSIPWKFCADIATSATEEQQDWFFKQFMSNQTMFVAASISEPEGMTDILLPYDEPGVAMKTFAYKDGSEWVINGDKMFCSAGGVADLILVAVGTDKNAPVTQAVSRFWVRKDTPGMTMEINRMISADITGNVQTHYDNVRVPEGHLVGEVNKGWPLLDIRISAKIIHFAGHLGRSQKLFEQLRDYAKERIQGGKPIIQHPNIAAMLGEAAINLESTRAYFYKAAWECDQHEEKTGSGLVNPFWGEGAFYLYKKMALRLCEIGTEVYGGIGGSLDMPLEKYVRRLFVGLPGGSTTNMNAIKCARHL